MRRVLTVLLLGGLAWGCGDDTPAPKPPEIISGLAQCRPVDGIFRLDVVEIVAEDRDGAEDLADVFLIVEASRLSPEATPEADEEGKMNRVRYRWERQTSDEPIFCGEMGALLQVEAKVVDADGFSAEALIKSTPL